MRFLLRVIPIFLIIMVGISLLRAFMNPKQPRRQATPGGTPRPTRGGKLVKDPFCGTYVTPDGSPTVSLQDETFYFCSEDCRDKFVKQAS